MRAWLAAILLMPSLLGCIGSDDSPDVDVTPTTARTSLPPPIDQSPVASAPVEPPPEPPAVPPYPRCVHPYPCGDEWPAGLTGPFPLEAVEHTIVESFDGTALDGYVYMPGVPAGVRVPVVLWTMPYFGQTYRTRTARNCATTARSRTRCP